MRDTYYQSAGNPVQLDRLPDTRPELELLAPEQAFESQLDAVQHFFALAAASALATLIFYQAPGISWLEPYDLLFAWPALICGIGGWILTQRVSWLLSTPVLAGIVLLALNRHTLWSGQVALTAGVGALAVYAFGRHWSFLCTTSPVSHRVAERLRQQWHVQLVVFAGITAILIAGLLLTRNLFFQTAMFVLPVTPFVIPAPGGMKRSRYDVILASLSSWFTYEARPLPGLFQSPVGEVHNRWGVMLLAVVLTAAALNRWPHSPLAHMISLGKQQDATIQNALDARHAPSSERLRYAGLTWVMTLASVVALPILVPLCLAVSATIPVSLEAATCRDSASDAGGVSSILADRFRSSDPTERASHYLGRVVADGSPALAPRIVYQEHAHGLGDSGCGKTSLFLCPTVEQLPLAGPCSIIVLDLKADSLELFATLRSVANTLRKKQGLRVPVRYFSNQQDKATFAFNPLRQSCIGNFDLLTRTDILCGANGRTYGTDYGAGYFSSANAAILYHTLKTFPHVSTFAELADCVGEVIATARKRDLNPEIRKAGVHVHEVMKRLGACGPLNVAESTGHDPAVLREAIDFTRVFQQPEFHYFHLSATLSPQGAPEIARLATYMLLAAGTQTERTIPVFLVIDEFQRMVASNLEYMLQLARSLGVGVILANQSLEDLKNGATNLIPVVEANCRLRQWFSVSCIEDQERLMRSAGTTVDLNSAWTQSTSSRGYSMGSSQTSQVVNRITINDILLTSDHPFRSILRISRGAGYAQYGGMPVIIESEFHISADEYQRRRRLPWPTVEGTFVPRDHRDPGARPTSPHPGAGPTPPPKPGPDITEEVIDDDDTVRRTPEDLESIDELFKAFKQGRTRR